MYKQQVIMGVEVSSLDEETAEVKAKMKGVDDDGYIKEWELPLLQIPVGVLDKLKVAMDKYYGEESGKITNDSLLEVLTNNTAILDRLRQAEVKIENLRKAVSAQAAIIDAQGMLLGEVLKTLKAEGDDAEKNS